MAVLILLGAEEADVCGVFGPDEANEVDDSESQSGAKLGAGVAGDSSR